MLQTSRRHFLRGLLAAPAVVAIGNIMPVFPERMDAAIRLVENYDIVTDQLITRLDILYGKLYVRPEWITLLEPQPARMLNGEVVQLSYDERTDATQSAIHNTPYDAEGFAERAGHRLGIAPHAIKRLGEPRPAHVSGSLKFTPISRADVRSVRLSDLVPGYGKIGTADRG